MQNVRFMPAATWSPAFLGPVRLAGAWPGPTPTPRGLGQPSGFQMPPAQGQPGTPQQVQDLPRVVTQEEVAAQPWTKEQAVDAYNMANLLRSIMEKLQFSKAQFGKWWSDPKISAAVTNAGAGAALNGTVASMNELIRSLTLPNMMASAQNMRAAMEVNVLPKFGVEVRGYAPLYRAGGPFAGTLDCVRTGNLGPMRAGMKEILDFGNLCETGFFTDIEAFRAAAKGVQEIAPEIRLSGRSLGIVIAWPVVALILGIAAIVFGGVVYFVSRSDTLEAAKAAIEKPEVRKTIIDACNELPPAERNACIREALKNPALYQKGQAPSDLWMWVGIGVGAIVATWIVSTLAGAGIFGKGKGKD